MSVSALLIRRVCVGVLMMMGLMSMVRALGNSNTSFRLRIYNSYSGQVELLPSVGTWIQDTQGRRWTNQDQVRMKLSVTTGSSYTVTGDIISPINGAGSGSYQAVHDVVLSSGDDPHHIIVQLIKGTEPLDISSPTIMVDTRGPYVVSGSIPDNSIVTGNIYLTRPTAVDDGIGVGSYIVLMGLTPSINSMVAFVSQRQSLSIHWETIPLGTIYYTIIPVDKLGNQGDYVMRYFHHAAPTVLGGNPSYEVMTGPIETGETIQAQVRSGVEFGDDVLPGFFPDEEGGQHHEVAHCPGLSIQRLDDCIERDRLLLAHQSGILTAPTKSTSARAWDDLPQDLTWVGRVDSEQDSSDNQSELVSQGESSIVSQDQQRRQIENSSIAGVLYQRYRSDPVPGWSIPAPQVDSPQIVGVHQGIMCDVFNYCPMMHPDARDYEQIMDRYQQPHYSYMRVFSWLVIFITGCLLMISMWFFVWGYHHHYVIRYLK